MCANCFHAPECYACIVGVATGPESHAACCPARGIPMPEQDGSFGPEWDAWERAAEQAKLAADTPCAHCGYLVRRPGEIRCPCCGNPWDGD